MKPLSLSTKRLMLRRAIDKDSENLYRNYTSDTVCSKFLTRQSHNDVKKTASTTGADYAKFMVACLKEKAMFESIASMDGGRDDWAVNQGLSDGDLKKVGWGIGWGLQKSSDGEKVTMAFHSGDMSEWRAFAAIDLDKKQGVVYFANSPNGLILADEIISPIVDLDAGFKYIFEKYGFARRLEPDWQEKERARVMKIIEKNEPEIWKLIQESLRVLNIEGESAGIVKISIADGTSEGKKMATITYIPDSNIKPPEKMLFGYRDEAGQGHQVAMSLNSEGQWEAKREILANESADFFLHPDVSPGELNQKPNIISKIALMNGKIVTDVYENTALSELEKGRIEKRAFKSDGTLSDPINDNYQLQPGERIIEIYLPAGYEPSSDHQYHLQVMLDGDMHLHQDPFGNSMGTKNILDNLIAQGKIEPVVAVFVAPTPPSREGNDWGIMPRLREYACDRNTDAFLANIPNALRQAGVPVTHDPKKACLSGQSMGGLQAIYTAKMHPQIYGQVIAQSPAVWWGPSPERLNGKEPDREVRYNDAPTWRAPIAEKLQQQYLLNMVKTGVDKLTRKILPSEPVNIFLQAGTRETGNCGLGDEPLTQATLALAKELGINCKIHNGGHSPDPWASGLAIALPVIHPKQNKIYVLHNESASLGLKSNQNKRVQAIVQQFSAAAAHNNPVPSPKPKVADMPPNDASEKPKHGI